MIQENISLAPFSSYKIGGAARYFAEASSEEELIATLHDWQKIKDSLTPEAQKIFIIGGGTNLLIDDKGYSGLVIHNKINFIHSASSTEIEFGAGLMMGQAIMHTKKECLSGFEWAGGLPGTVGGAVRGNAGAFGGEIKDNLLRVKSVNFETLEISNREGKDLKMSYRNSYYKIPAGQSEMIISATFKFDKGDCQQIADKIKEHIQYRLDHQPVGLPNAGSIFKNVPAEKVNADLIEKYRLNIKTDPFPVIPVARLLSEVGVKGATCGGAQISEVHPNFIVNLGNATANDIKTLIKLAQERVEETFKVKIEPEVVILNY